VQGHGVVPVKPSVGTDGEADNAPNTHRQRERCELGTGERSSAKYRTHSASLAGTRPHRVVVGPPNLPHVALTTCLALVSNHNTREARHDTA
jgi:hypothetical protein